jgi:hypothetical protein
MSPNHANCGAWGIQENSIERSTIPPTTGFTGVPANDLSGGLPKTLKGVSEGVQSLIVYIHCHHFREFTLSLENMCGFPARRGACIEYSRPSLKV